MKQPSAVAHMGWSGLRMGVVLGAIYGLVYIIAMSIQMMSMFEYILPTIPPYMLLGGLLGGLFGLPMGLFIGLVLGVKVEISEMPLRPADIQSIKKAGQIAAFLAGFGAFGVILYLMGGNFLIYSSTILLVIIPLCIAFFASIRAVNRYLKKLETFMNGKSKTKREATA